MSWALQLAVALAIFVAGGVSGVKFHAGVDAQRELVAEALRQSDGIQQRKFSDLAAGTHAGAVAKLSTQLGDARVQISKLSGRECFGADTGRVLSAIGTEPVRAAAGDIAAAPESIATSGGFRFSTDRDAAGAIATCRAYYGEVSSQVNQMLDIEDRRYPLAP